MGRYWHLVNAAGTLKKKLKENRLIVIEKNYNLEMLS